MTEDKIKSLPKGWVWTKLSDLIHLFGGFAFKSSEYKKNGIPILRMGNITKKFRLDFNKPNQPYLPESSIEEFKDYLLKKNDIVMTLTDLSKSGEFLGTVAMINNDAAAFLNQRVSKIEVYDPIYKTFLFYSLQNPVFRSYMLQDKTGSLQRNTNHNYVYDYDFALPPLPEQHRIVAKIEELFTKLDAGVEALRKVNAQLRHYRQAVLKYAFEGKLTKEWREANKGKIEPTSVLLERIKEERKRNAKGKYREFPPIDTSKLPGLPEGWVWTNFTRLISPQKNSIKRGPFGSTIKKAFFVEKGFKVYEQQSAIYDNSRLGNYYINQEKFNELIDFEVKPGDFIVSCSGTIGKIARIPENAEKGVINQALLKLTIDTRLVSPEFFLELFRSDEFQKKVLKETRGSAIKNINSVEDIKIIPVALPPLVEQQKIVEEIESRLSIADNMGKVAEQSLKQSDRLRQSILKRAFEGKLVPQDPTDEPAEKLLERIKEEKAKKESGSRKVEKAKNLKQMELI